MDLQMLRMGLGHLAMVMATTATLIAQPGLAPVVALIVGVTLMSCAGSSLGLGYLYLSREGETERETLPKNHSAYLGTCLGGMLCYSVILTEAMRLIFLA